MREVTGQALDLTAGSGIGRIDAPLDINIVSDGRLQALTATGDIRIHETVGDLIYTRVSTGDGDVALSADMNIAGAAPDSLITGNRVTLTAEHASIGTFSDFVRVDSGAFAAGGLDATSVGDMHITEIAGDLYLVRAESMGGDVTLDVPGGGIVDNNTIESVDERAKAELLSLWDDMQLMGEEAEKSAEKTVSAYERMQERDYDTYWKYRHRQENSAVYDSDFRVALTQAEADYYTETLGWDEGKITAYEDSMTAEYRELHAVYGAEGNAYDADWTYEVANGSEEWNRLTEGSAWTREQLENAIGVGMIKEVSDTEIRIEDPNAAGRDVSLTAAGMIGADKDQVTITIEELRRKPWSELDENDPAEKAILDKILILTAAEKSDIVSQSADAITIQLREDVDVQASGALDVNGAGSVYIGSEADLNIGRIAAGGNLRIKGQKGIYTAADDGAINIIAGDAVIEAGDNGVGSDDKPFVIDLGEGASLTARAGADIFIREVSGDMYIDSLYAVRHIDIDSPASILDADQTGDLDIRAETLSLTAQGSIGGAGAGRFLDIGLDATGFLNAAAGGDIYISSPRHVLTTGAVTAGGNIALFGGEDIRVMSGAISRYEGETVSATYDGGIETEFGTVAIDADHSILDADDDETAGIVAQDIRLIVQAGRIGSGDNALEIDTLSQGRSSLTAPLGVYVTETAGMMDVESASAATGDIRLTARAGDMRVDRAEVTDDGDIYLNVLDGDADVDYVSAPGDVVIIVNGMALDIGTIDPAGIDLSVTGAGGAIRVAQAMVSEEVRLRADNIQIDVTDTTPSDPLVFNAAGSNGGMAAQVEIDTRSGSAVIFRNLAAEQARLNANVDVLNLNSVTIGNRGVFNNSRYRVIVDNQNWLLQDCDAQLYAPGRSFYLNFSANPAFFTDSLVLNYDSDFTVNGFGTENSIFRAAFKLVETVNHSNRTSQYYEYLDSLNERQRGEFLDGNVPIVFLANDQFMDDNEFIDNADQLELMRVLPGQ